MILKSQAIKAFLTEFAPPDLASLYNHDMEVQVNVAKDNGDRVEGDYKGKLWLGYTDGIQTWKPIRIPLFANTEPEYTDSPMSYSLLEHAEGIGMTGWDWKSRLSRWVAFDFDAIVGHSDKHAKKLSDAELEQIVKALQGIPCVTIRKSTGGKGLHLYVFLEPVTTANHNEHAAVARAILSQLSGLAGFDFGSKVDICGGNMWVWHRKMKGTDGLAVIKKGTTLASVPANWRDYTKVVSGRRPRNLPRFIEEQASSRSDIEDVFAELTGQRIRVKPDEEHKRLMNWLFDSYGSATWWDAENHMLVTHTYLLKLAHDALGLRGRFETDAKGTEKGFDHNCYMFPMSRGAWAVRRFSPGVKEHVFWEQDGAGWTRCFYNQELTLPTAARIYNGLEDTKGNFHFSCAEDAQNAALLLGANLNIPNRLLTRQAKVYLDKQGRLVVEVVRHNSDHPMEGWIAQAKNFQRIFTIRKSDVVEDEIQQFDDEIRHLVNEDGDDCGWVIKAEGRWNSEPYQHVKTVLLGMGHKAQDVSVIMSSNIRQPWTLVNRPFKEEYPKDRQWNRGAAQLRYRPSLNRDDLKFPTWLKILEHCGAGLNEAVSESEWCKSNVILKGSDWLKCWIASMFQEPAEPLPYLFFYSQEQNTGKSIFHEAISLLMTSGMARADNALTSSSGFNGELEHAVLCVVEETDLKQNKVAYNRIKDWVTSRMLPIHKKGKTPYTILNTSHWVQCANSHLYCPVFQGDTRITMIRVSPIEESQLIPKRQLIPLLESEAPDFLADILALELPPSNDRLNVPCLMTGDKAQAAIDNQSDLDFFLQEHCCYAPGWAMKYDELWDKFLEKLDANQAGKWTKQRMGKELPPQFVKGRHKSSGQYWIGNIALGRIPAESHGKRIALDGKMTLYIPDESRYFTENPK